MGTQFRETEGHPRPHPALVIVCAANPESLGTAQRAALRGATQSHQIPDLRSTIT